MINGAGFGSGFFDGPIAQQILAGETAAAREDMIAVLNGADHQSLGRVSIIGTGPGDPDLLTLKALQRMQDADVVLYDKLIGPEILDYVRRDAERLYVGKSAGDHHKSQDEIHALMVAHAKAGAHVVRLKGGDPFIFGRGGEEVEYLAARNVPVEVVPGVSAANGCAASAGIPLTHRDHANGVTFVTGHSKAGEPDLDWASLASLDQTLVIYMGRANAVHISQQLITHGLSSSTPVAVIENGSLPNQKVVRGIVSDLARMIDEAQIDGPALLIIGDVAGSVQDQSQLKDYSIAVRRRA